MENDEWVVFIAGLLIGIILVVCTIGAITNYKNLNVDVGLSKESADLVCQKITNNTNAIAIDWTIENDEPEDSLICEILEKRIDGGLIQIIEN